MRNEMQCNNEQTQKSVNIEKLQEDLRRLELQVAALSNANMVKAFKTVEAGEPPHVAATKCQMCKHCSHMRMPHRSNPHYTCDARHATIEPTWTCGLFNDKTNHGIVEPTAMCGH